MKGNFVERPEPMRPTEVEWQNVKHLTDQEGRIWSCLPLGCEHQMFEIVNCHGCGRPAKWIGVGCPFGDGREYLLESEAWCYWCLPRELFNEEELRLARQAEWARKQTVDEVAEIVLNARSWDDDKLDEFLLDLSRTIRAVAVTREEQLLAWAQ
jgi:hypothetical protein